MTAVDYRTEDVNCNLCKGSAKRLIHRANGLSIVRCLDCGLVYTSPRLSKESLFRLYKDEYFNNARFYDRSDKFLYGYEDYSGDKEEIQASFQKIFKTIKEFKSPGRLLEIGCAMGFFLETAREKGWDGYGFEISETASQYAKKALGLNVHTGEFTGSEFPPSYFDAVTLFDVIEHLGDPMAELVKYYKVLKPEGLLVLSTLNADSPVARALGKRWEDFRRNKSHLYIFSRSTISLMLERAGFKVIRVEQYGRYFTADAIAKRLSLYGKGVTAFMRSVSRLLGISNRMFYIVPFTKIIVYAEKRR